MEIHAKEHRQLEGAQVNTMTLASVQENLGRLRTLTGKTCSAYICGPKTYDELRSRLLGIPGKAGDFTFCAVKIYQSAFCPDDGKFYPADYLERGV